MIKNLLNLTVVPTQCLQRALVLFSLLIVVAAAGWLPAAALAQATPPRPSSGPTLTQSIVIAQASRKAKKWPLWIWIGIGGGDCSVHAIVIGRTLARQPPSATQAHARHR